MRWVKKLCQSSKLHGPCARYDGSTVDCLVSINPSRILDNTFLSSLTCHVGMIKPSSENEPLPNYGLF